jgi:hypothetical protein
MSLDERESGYKLIVKPHDDGTFSLDLVQNPPNDSRPTKRGRSTYRSSISGWHLDSALGLIKRTLKESGYKPTDLKRSRRTPFKLDETSGVRLNILFKALKDVKKRSRSEDIIFGISDMSREEALYWHSKLEQDLTRSQQKGVKALRILLGGE